MGLKEIVKILFSCDVKFTEYPNQNKKNQYNNFVILFEMFMNI